VDLGETFVRFEVQPLDEVQAGTFVYTWFRVAYERLELTPDAAKEKARALVELLGQPAYRIGRMAELRSNPLLLTILCLVYHEDASLPRSRVRLYERCVKVLLETWRQQVHTQHGGRPYNPDAARQVLSSVAWWMHEEDNRRSVPLADMEARAAVTLQQFPNSGLGTDGREFLRLMREDSGIVAASGAGYAEFLHLTFQEYLAALYAVQHNSAAELAGAVGASWWQEVILLALAQGTPAFSEGFFDALLQGKTLEEHADFVTRCLQESEPLVAEPFVRQLRNTKTPLRRKLAVLRQLRTYGFPDLLDICRGWTEHSNRELSALTREILERAGQRLVPAEATAVEVAPAEFVDEKTGIAFVRIRAGEFPMGDETREWSKPIHKVRITRDFYLGKYPVTNEEYARFLDATQYNPPSQWNERRFNQPRQPVVGVSWDDAQAFCQWAGCRLPTEAEWEYGCRAGRTTAFSFGDDEKMLTEFAWYDQNSNSQTQPVGSKTPNPWGLYDMHGNVWEWCQDFFNDEYYRDSPQDDPPGAAEPQVPKSWGWAKVWERPRVLRGGSWQSAGVSCRSGDRCAGLPAGRNVGVGLRVVRPRSSQPVAGGARPA
jgi:formylglycine-generating enzyme required for sulfatase activity